MNDPQKMDLILETKFDTITNRQYLNKQNIVFHCHHYSTLYTQLAIDAGEAELLADVAENSFYKMLSSYFVNNNITDFNNKIDLACKYYSAIGLGKMKVNYIAEYSGQVELEYSHLDTGWIKKWGNHDQPVNYISSGFISAMFSLLNNKAKNTYHTYEEKSIVMGDKTSIFKVFIK